MGVAGNGERSTICGEGCAMTSLSMALAGLNIPISGESDAACYLSWGALDMGTRLRGSSSHERVDESA